MTLISNNNNELNNYQKQEKVQFKENSNNERNKKIQFKDVLIAYRKYYAISINDLSKKSGVKTSHIKSVEQGNQEPNPKLYNYIKEQVSLLKKENLKQEPKAQTTALEKV